jgi:hypothetical protein
MHHHEPFAVRRPLGVKICFASPCQLCKHAGPEVQKIDVAVASATGYKDEVVSKGRPMGLSILFLVVCQPDGDMATEVL